LNNNLHVHAINKINYKPICGLLASGTDNLVMDLYRSSDIRLWDNNLPVLA